MRRYIRVFLLAMCIAGITGVFTAGIAYPFSGISSLPFPGTSDVIAFGGNDGNEIVVSSDMVTLDIRYIDQDLYWDDTALDVDSILFRTIENSGSMDCYFHLPST